MRYKIRISLLITCLALVSCARAMASKFKIQMDDQVFVLDFPVPPEKEFAKYRSVIPLNNESFGSANSVLALKVHWKFRSGLLQKVAGVMEVQVTLNAAHQHEVDTLDGLKQQILADFKRDLAKVGYSGADVQFESLRLSDRVWLKYQVPILRVTEYSTSLSDKRFLTAQFSFIDNSGKESPAWHQEANALGRKITESMRVE